MIKKFIGYILILASLVFAFFRGKKQGELDCIDFNVLPMIGNSITVIACIGLTVFGLVLVLVRKK
ncbi:hypothetical protein [Winogradskyella undariae]|uniref:hypothetical protein n=1 Tax=Winogradskyella undariae TaxID=1285465 RepID=UPI0015C8E9B5|nr:hypothetical protein [Winogradskyella undariae]